MMTNVGVIDRALRLIVGAALLALASEDYGPSLPSLLAWPAGLAGAYAVITGLLRYCPIFALTGASTCAEEI